KIMADFKGQALPDAFKVEEGKRGRKDGQGLYRWENGKPVKPEVPKDYQAPEDLEDRLILPLPNEAVSCLHDGVVADADLLDAGVIFGTGFAPFRGGPISHIRAAGGDELRARLGQLAGRCGSRCSPAPGWDSLGRRPRRPRSGDGRRTPHALANALVAGSCFRGRLRRGSRPGAAAG